MEVDRRQIAVEADPDTERGHTVRDHLLRVRNEFKNGAPQRLKRAALRLLEPPQILVDLLSGHRFSDRARIRLCQDSEEPGAYCLIPIDPSLQRRARHSTRRWLNVRSALFISDSRRRDGAFM